MAKIQIYERQGFILGVIHEMSSSVSRHFLQLFTFYAMAYRKAGHYAFFPTLQGPYSLRLEADIDFLLKQHFIEEGENAFSTGPSFQQAALSRATWQKSRQLKQLWLTLPVTWINDLKREFPAYWLAAKTHSSHRDSSLLLTLGYEGLSVEAYFKHLVEQQANVLVDVRKNPYSRKFGFTKRKLEKACELTDMRYQHLPELGIPKAMRTHVDTEQARQELLAYYEQDILPNQYSAFYYLQQLLVREGPLALLCYEKDAAQCHRSRLAKHLNRELGGGLQVKHMEFD